MMALTTPQKRAAAAVATVAVIASVVRPWVPSPGPGGSVSIMSGTAYPGPSWGSGTATWTPSPAPTATGTPEPIADRWFSPPPAVLSDEIESFEAEWPESADALNNAKADIEQRNLRNTFVSGDTKFHNGCGATDVQIGGGDPDDAADHLLELLGPADLSLQGVFERGPRLFVMVFRQGIGSGELAWPDVQPTRDPTSAAAGVSHPDDHLGDAIAITVGTFPVGDAIVAAVGDCGGFHESIFWIQESLAGGTFYLTRW